ncbi:MAG: elongation factor 4 [Elusimicrobia bacterium RIFOXYB2_FULL_49_7]|nr:MAG: elongation factor 4 [Elusimicrobia bacterium RIFOXYB2_FULL_49_7]
MEQSRIRNFCIIAHIDHGKSTLADRLLEKTGTLDRYQMMDQVLDNMDLERERGITIKAHAIRMVYKAKDGIEYVLNLIDTPGHVDFTYEVSRSLSACEGAILVVDASQGVEAQTLSNLYLALGNDMTIIPVLNKIDLPSADVPKAVEELNNLLGGDIEPLLISAKDGTGVEAVLEAVVKQVPPPKGNPDAPLKALIFDSVFDSYRGAVAFVRVVDGVLKQGSLLRFFAIDQQFGADEVGHLKLKRVKVDRLETGEVGYLIANIKRVADIKIGDTVTTAKEGTAEPLPGYQEVKPMVYCGLYPENPDNYDDLRDSLDKLALNDSSISWEPETSTALGFGFRAGFLGLLHMEIIQERLDREFGVDIINTVPNVKYRVRLRDGAQLFLENPSKLPAVNLLDYLEEPYVIAKIIVPTEYVGNMMKLGEEKRGVYISMEYLDPTRVNMQYEFPLAEIIFDFFDRLKSLSRGYASFDYEFKEYRQSDLVKLDILINANPVDAFSIIIHRDKAYTWGQNLATRLKDLIPRQMFEVVIQAAIGSRVISRTVVKPLRKNVTAKCYGGDISRKRKLLEKQKEGKKRMKQVGQVEIPQEAFFAVLSMNQEAG